MMITPISEHAVGKTMELLIRTPSTTTAEAPTTTDVLESSASVPRDGYINGIYEGVYGGVPGENAGTAITQPAVPSDTSYASPRPAEALPVSYGPNGLDTDISSAKINNNNAPAQTYPANQQQWLQYYGLIGYMMADGAGAGLVATDPITGRTGNPYSAQDPLVYAMGAAGGDAVAAQVDSASPEWMAGYNLISANPDAAWKSWCQNILPNQKALNEQLNPYSAENLRNRDQSQGGRWISGPDVQVGAPVTNPDVSTT